MEIWRSRKVLVAYATKMGATAGIADLIGDVLRCNGHDVDVLGVTEVSSIEPYDAVVLGSAIFVRRWRRQAMQSSAATLTSPRLGDRHQRRDRRHRVPGRRARRNRSFGAAWRLRRPIQRRRGEIRPRPGALAVYRISRCQGAIPFGCALVPRRVARLAHRLREH
jgi:hypothetical protein